MWLPSHTYVSRIIYIKELLDAVSRKVYTYICIKTHNSESRGQGESKRTIRDKCVVKLAKALNKQL